MKISSAFWTRSLKTITISDRVGIVENKRRIGFCRKEYSRNAVPAADPEMPHS